MKLLLDSRGNRHTEGYVEYAPTCDRSCSLAFFPPHYITSKLFSLQGGKGVGVKGKGGDVSSDPPLIIRRCQSLHNTENSAPSHVEHPRSLTWWLSTHGFMCLYYTESKQQGGSTRSLSRSLPSPLVQHNYITVA